ncbi:hypothetical protein ACFE04_013192 [Oxalis oulophora]
MTSQESQTCFFLPPNVNSNGMYVVDAKNGYWLNSSMPRFEIMAVFIVIVSQACHFLLQHFGFPMFLSHLIAGRTLAFILQDHPIMNAEDGIKVLSTIATLGYAACVFQIGVKVDLGMIGRAGKKAFCIGVFSVIVSVLCGLIAAKLLLKNDNEFHSSFFFLVLTTSSTSFPVVTSLLNDLKIANSELGRIGQSAALISDIISMVLVNGIITTKLKMEENSRGGFEFLGILLILLFVTIFIVRPAMNWIVRKTPKNGRVKDAYIYSIICLFLVSTSLNKWSPQFMIAPYIIGLGIPTGLPLGTVIAEKFDGLNSGLFMPLFVATCAMRKDLSNIHRLQGSQIVANSIVISLTLLAKFGASFAILVSAKFPKRDGCALALVMCAKGFVEMATVSFLYDNKVFSSDLLCLMSIVVVVVGSVTPVLVKILFDPSRRYTTYERRTIMNLSPNSNLQILTPIHLPNHVSAITNLLEASGASGEKPIGVHVLHLIKLSGQAAPVFISHDKQKADYSDNCPYSENVILSFTRFEANNWGSVSINIFTAISTPNLMYEDVCNLALDSSSSIIILPFHRRWYLDGSVESDDNSLRVLNQMVLDRAPCSVGILVDRGYKRRMTSMESSAELTQQNVAMVFLGGNDDREALVFAKRMAEDHNIKLTVARLISAKDTDISSWSRVLDTEALRDIKSDSNIRYVEHQANDGPDTAMIIRAMMKEFDLFIVGRAYNLECPQTAGLDEWVEYPELGIIGDMFVVAADFDEKFSVLVVQQHFTSTVKDSH